MRYTQNNSYLIRYIDAGLIGSSGRLLSPVARVDCYVTS